MKAHTFTMLYEDMTLTTPITVYGRVGFGTRRLVKVFLLHLWVCTLDLTRQDNHGLKVSLA